MKRDLADFSQRYVTALQACLKHGHRGRLRPAEKMGREAVRIKLRALDLAMIQRYALTELVSPSKSFETSDEKLGRAADFDLAEAFFVEAIKPIDLNNCAAMKANVQLQQLNKSMHQRTRQLAASNQKLKKEIARRRAGEQALKKSQQHYRELLAQSRRQQKQLRHLSHQLLRAQEEERKQISRELHDDIAQTLTGLTVHLATLKTQALSDTRGLEKRISKAQDLVEASVEVVHRFARTLRPTVLDDLGLIPALRSLVKDFKARTGIQVHCTTFAGVERLTNAKRTVLYRVAQSALANVAQHAKASRVRLSIRRLGDTVRMDIRDNGVGFDVEQVLYAKRHKRLGLLGMRERVEMVNGRFGIESASGKGTTLRAQIPLGNGQSG
jgi:signal transduction histidine kinase